MTYTPIVGSASQFSRKLNDYAIAGLLGIARVNAAYRIGQRGFILVRQDEAV